jgi:Family of unknown function (DUF6677)
MAQTAEPQQLDPFAAVLAWVVPGLGHIAIGQRQRGLILMVSIHLMMAVGLFIGGIDVVDRKEDRWWYMGQVMGGPIPLLIDRYHQSLKVEKRHPRSGQVVLAAPGPGDNPAYEPSLSRVNELGTLFVTLAGMLNLMCIIDVAQHPKRQGERRVERPRDEGLVGTVEARDR